MTGFVPFADVEQHFDGAALFVNTSIGEGFPNTFLQAWSRGIPTVSFFDPLVQLDGAPVAFVEPDLDSMRGRVAALLDDRAAWQQAGARARRAFEQRHSVARTIDAYERVIHDVLSRSARGAVRAHEPA